VEARVARFRKEPAGTSSPDIVLQAPLSSSVSAVLCMCSGQKQSHTLPIFDNGPCVFQLFVNRREFETLSATPTTMRPTDCLRPSCVARSRNVRDPRLWGERSLVLIGAQNLAVLFTASLALLTSVESITAPNTGLAGHSVCWVRVSDRWSLFTKISVQRCKVCACTLSNFGLRG
jgi:hypothetical protein